MVKPWLYHCQTMVDHAWKSQLRTQASSRYPSYQRRLGTERNNEFFFRRIFPTSLAGDVTSEIAEDDWVRGCRNLSLQGPLAGKQEYMV